MADPFTNHWLPDSKFDVNPTLLPEQKVVTPEAEIIGATGIALTVAATNTVCVDAPTELAETVPLRLPAVAVEAARILTRVVLNVPPAALSVRKFVNPVFVKIDISNPVEAVSVRLPDKAVPVILNCWVVSEAVPIQVLIFPVTELRLIVGL